MGYSHSQQDKYRGSQTSASMRLPQYAETRFLSGDDEPSRWPASVAVELAIFGLHHLTETLDGLPGVARHTWGEQPVLLILLDDEVEGIKGKLQWDGGRKLYMTAAAPYDSLGEQMFSTTAFSRTGV